MTLQSDKALKTAEAVNQAMQVVDFAASCVHHVATAALIFEAKRDNKWNDYKARIATGCIEALSSAVEFAETLRRYKCQTGELNLVTEKIRNYMVSFRGSLPENSYYYVGKDVFKVAAYGVSAVMLESSSLGGTAFANAVVALNQGRSGKYLDDVLSAIMNNLEFYSSQLKVPGIAALYKQSLDNLKYQLGDKLSLSYNSANDSKMVQNAIQFYRKLQSA
jgi:hypothetical protein